MSLGELVEVTRVGMISSKHAINGLARIVLCSSR